MSVKPKNPDEIDTEEPLECPGCSVDALWYDSPVLGEYYSRFSCMACYEDFYGIQTVSGEFVELAESAY